MSIEGVIGSDFADMIYGNDANNTLEGGDGADRIVGGAGNDTIIGDSDRDATTGGAGADTFVFRTVDDFDMGLGAQYGDKINDFSQAEGDRVDLSELGDLTFIGTAGFTASGVDEVRNLFGNSSSVQIDVNSDGISDAVLQLNRIAPQASDFVL